MAIEQLLDLYIWIFPTWQVYICQLNIIYSFTFHIFFKDMFNRLQSIMLKQKKVVMLSLKVPPSVRFNA